jgi:integrase/recombinase XerD
VQSFFTEHLHAAARDEPAHGGAYRDAFVLFLDFATARLHKQPTAMKLRRSRRR